MGNVTVQPGALVPRGPPQSTPAKNCSEGVLGLLRLRGLLGTTRTTAGASQSSTAAPRRLPGAAGTSASVPRIPVPSPGPTGMLPGIGPGCGAPRVSAPPLPAPRLAAPPPARWDRPARLDRPPRLARGAPHAPQKVAPERTGWRQCTHRSTLSLMAGSALGSVAAPEAFPQGGGCIQDGPWIQGRPCAHGAA